MGSVKILAIEDDRDIAELIEYNLRQEKFAVDLARTGGEGLAKARRTAPDLIVLDLMLPDLDGLEVCRRLKSDPKTQTRPVLMLTAKGSEVDDEVDDLNRKVLQDLIGLMQKDSATVVRGMHLVWISKQLEKIADHATNIAEEVIFMVQGRDIRHGSSKDS